MPRQTERPKITLTKTALSRLKPEASKYIQWDTKTDGFGVRVYPSGAMSYVVVVASPNPKTGRTSDRMHTIGKVADIDDPSQAREQAVALRRKLLAGIDPKEEARRQRDLLITLREAMVGYYLSRSASSKASTLIDTCKGLRYSYEHLLDRPVCEVSDDDVIDAYRTRRASSPARAAVEARYLRAAWNWITADKPHLELGPCPVTRINRLKEWSKPKPRTSRLTLETAPTWWKTTAEMLAANERDGVLFATLLYTGARVGELVGLRWQHVDLNATVPSFSLLDTKTRTDVTLPIPRQLRGILQAWREQSAHTAFVFPAASKTGLVVPMPYPSVGTKNHRIRSGVEWAPHDLRRTYVSAAELSGVPSFVVRRLTNHAIDQGDAHDGYRVAHLEDLAPWSQKVADTLQRWTAPPSVVVPLRAGGVA